MAVARKMKQNTQFTQKELARKETTPFQNYMYTITLLQRLRNSKEGQTVANVTTLICRQTSLQSVRPLIMLSAHEHGDHQNDMHTINVKVCQANSNTPPAGDHMLKKLQLPANLIRN